MTISEKLNRLAERKNISKTELGAYCGMTPRALNNYFSGRRIPQGEYLERIAAVLEIDPMELTDDTAEIPVTSEELFLYTAESPRDEIKKAQTVLFAVKQLLSDARFEQSDKRKFFACLTEFYASALQRTD
ncbi:MAG: helix-turn-helix domain-containing protein [Oscillospiraceae bacterium]|jgi:transcriptional regulator with XRE-family HTH domain|nr:helix-turn-helix domain-containing protein [Oscillospiraceae bacterium]